MAAECPVTEASSSIGFKVHPKSSLDPAPDKMEENCKTTNRVKVCFSMLSRDKRMIFKTLTI